MNKKRGMSIAAVLAIMICLISLVTTVFLVASRNSSLTSKSLRYIESYNEASTSIDNSVDFMVDESNKATTLNGTFVLSKIEVIEGLFGVDANLDVTDTSLDLSAGFLIEITKEYDGGILYSAVSFRPGGASGVITPEILIDKEALQGTKLEQEQLLKERFNSMNLLWDYWNDQVDTGKNLFVKELGITGSLVSFADDINKNFLNPNGDIKSRNTAGFVQVITNALENRNDLFNEGFLGSILGFLTGKGGGTHNDLKDLPRKTEGNKTIITIDKNTQVNNGVEWMSEQGKRYEIRVINGAIFYMRGALTTNADIYIERGSTMVSNSKLTMKPYKTSSGSVKCPIFDTDYTGFSSYNHVFDEYIGGGFISKESFYYECMGNNAVIGDGYVKGGITVSQSIKIYAGPNKDKEYSQGKLPVGITGYCDNECEFTNIGFLSKPGYVRPFFLFCNGEVYLKWPASLTNGLATPYKEGMWSSTDSVGFGIITCEKIEGLKCGDVCFPIKMNLFYNSKSQMDSDKDKGILLNATNTWLGTKGIDVTYNLYNDFINNYDVMNAAGGSQEAIEISILNWYIPPKLRGQMQMMATQAIQSKK